MSEGINIWEFRDTAGHTAGTDLIGFHVEATDGHIGKVDRLSEHVDAQYLVVDTGPWIFGRLVLLPAGTVVRIELGERKVYVDRSKDEIRNSPPYDPGTPETVPALRTPFALYYSPFYGSRIP
ncbi:PRC-barrel domain protein [Streptomyces sp. 1114.5]|uniref:PRC-barrel domain-containing protein n=1 Tax=Streptomyces sp. 1114.5 TaxID=1938830 RepID=UPI000EB36EA7|nr:PRC-barrel domain-containing protein [Streptomyces sp. 1114.5]RKT09890.1 PRC-barrel domain protein [Streptomyces sp. 1114.5]